MTPLEGWHDFYVIVGSSAGALIGLQFVVITLIASLPIRSRSAQGSSAFATPTVVHFATVLLLAAALTTPWHGVAGAPVVWGLVGSIGVLYTSIVAKRMRTQTAYRPEFEDWLCHALLPFAAYITLVISSFLASSNTSRALFGVAVAVLVLLFVGIHNAWDAVTYHVFVSRTRTEPEESSDQARLTKP